MKTVTAVAASLGVTRQAIYRRLSALPSDMLSTDKKGVQLISVDGETFLKNILSENMASGQSANSPADNRTDRLISMLQVDLDAKNKQIEEQQQTITDLNKTIQIQAQTIKNDSQNDLVENIVSAISKNELEIKNNIIQELNKRVAELERMLAEPKNESAAVTIIDEDISQAVDVSSPQVPNVPQADKKKKNGLLSWLFGKNKNSDNV
jgi:hypothetical protein